jgi:D-alanyl-D-alanine carboxypeptidase
LREVLILITKKELRARVLLIVVCLAVGLYCLYTMDKSYDPLARYPYTTDENREILLKYFDSDDIDYLVNQHISPDKFMDFVELKDFNLKNTLYYKEAKETQDADNEYIVNFVNRFRKNFSYESLKELLSHYSYLDLTTFYENEAVLYSDLRLVADPTNPYVVLNQENTVYKFAPEKITSFNGIMIQSVLVEDLQNMMDAYASVMNEQDRLTLTSGYLSYEQIMDQYVNASKEYDGVDKYMYNAGKNEQQLGYTVVFEGQDEWIHLCKEHLNEDMDYALLDEELSDEVKNRMEWLEENAYRYGFVIRYEKEQEKKTGHWYQPFVLRYVGKKMAKYMHDSYKVMEQVSFPDELE